MGLFDTVTLHEDVQLPEYPAGAPPPETVEWQTKGIDRPSMSTFRITTGGRLLKENWHSKEVPPENRPHANREDVDEDDVLYMAGALERVHDGWTERDNYHGRFKIKRSFDDIDGLVTYEVTFTHGRLEGFDRIR